VSEWQERLGEAMEARALSGGELARRTGFTPQYINSLRSKERGARLPHDTAARISAALGISVEWLTSGSGPRERLSDVYPIYAPPDSALGSDRYPTRAEALALLATTAEPEVVTALRSAVPPDPAVDPGLDYWIGRARQLTLALKGIKADPVLSGRAPETRAPETRAPETKGKRAR
jgi:transcriptional regulator with XRE-family HTH domain